MIDQNFEENLPKFLADVESTLGSKKFLCGEKLSIGDFYIGNLYVSWLVNPLAYEPERRAALL
jgi:glutathione S-transferase